MRAIRPARGRSAAARAAAAAWIARLHGPNRTRELEEGLRRWLHADPEHAAAFELLTDIWEKSAHLDRARSAPAAIARPVAARPRLLRAVLATILIALAPSSILRHPGADVVATGIGELRNVTLADGTQIHLDADTRLLVHLGRHSRHVVLVQGQAYFKVAHRAAWPFIVTAAGHAIRDIGTEFDVRDDDDLLAVTLVEGKVTVSGAQAFNLAPGERLTFDGARLAKIDWPPMAQVTAWETGEVSLANTSLADAAAQLNRYSRQRIEIVDPAIAAIRVSGIVQAGDSASFAEAVAKTYGLKVLRPARDLIVLASGH